MLLVEVGRMATVGGRPFLSIGVTVGTLALPLLPLAMGSTVIDRLAVYILPSNCIAFSDISCCLCFSSLTKRSLRDLTPPPLC